MDDFREWLSDNLRYFMLGGAILLVVLVLIFGIRACVGGKDKGKPETENQTATQEQGTDPSSQTNKGETDEEKKESANPLEKGSSEITALIESYYKALGQKDVDTLKTLVDDLAPADESKIVNATYIEGYNVGNVYTKKGLDDNSYVIYACYDYVCSGISTPVPAMSRLYAFKNTEGKWLIDGDADSDAEISKYAESLESDDDVQKLYADVKAKNDQAQKDDPELAVFLQGLGEDAGNTVSDTTEGTTFTVTEGCNVRDSADGEIIGGLEAGTKVEKKGQDGEWIQIDYEGQTGYVHSSLLE